MDEARRRFLTAALSLGVLAGGTGWRGAALADWLGRRPGPLPEGRSIFRIRGEVLVNGEPADRDTIIRPRDHVRTGDDAELVAVVGEDAFMLRERSEVELSLGDRMRQGLRLLSGAMLNVFGEREPERSLEVRTPTAYTGIRGTGLYVEAWPESSYVCNCYGAIEIAAATAPQVREQIISQHHDDPRWVLAEGPEDELILPAPFINHSDMELILLESLVGRTVPFGAPGRAYRRQQYYPD